MQNARLEEAQAGIQIVGEISMAESKEELKILLMKVKEESGKVGLNSTFGKQRSCFPVQSLHGK